jgi:hypothetical protein
MRSNRIEYFKIFTFAQRAGGNREDVEIEILIDRFFNAGIVGFRGSTQPTGGTPTV